WPVGCHQSGGSAVCPSGPSDHLPLERDEAGDHAALWRRGGALPRDSARRRDRVLAAGVTIIAGRGSGSLWTAETVPAASRDCATTGELHHHVAPPGADAGRGKSSPHSGQRVTRAR